MNEENSQVASAQAGSATSGPATSEAGQPQVAGTGIQSSDQGVTGGNKGSQNYEELEKKFGEQGKELGEYRDFVKNLTPLLSKLEENPQFAQAIAEGKVDSTLMKAVLEGKVKIEEAQQVVQAHEQVKQDMGVKAYAQASPAEIEKRVKEDLSKTLSEHIDKRFKDAEESKEFEENVQMFINNTPDFPEFADKISDWLKEHPDQDDIEVAYFAVKGKLTTEQAKEQATKNAGEEAKNVAANAGGGSVPSSGKANTSQDVWEQLVSPRSNPNLL